MRDHSKIMRVGGLTLDLTTGEARRGDRSAGLTRTDAALLALFMRDPDRLFSYQELIDEHPHWRGVATRRLVKQSIHHLRRALGDDLIQNVHGIGYGLGTATPRARRRPVLQAGDLKLDSRRRLWHAQGRRARGPVHLTPRETNLVECLMRRAGRIATDEELMRVGDIGNNARYRESRRRLRKKLRGLGADHLLVSSDGGYRLARGRSGLRRIAGLELDLAERSARLEGRPLELGPAWVALLERLAIAPGQPVSRAELVAHAWGKKAPKVSLDSIVGELQRALGATGPRLIVSTGDGYRLAIERFGLLAVGPVVLDPAARCVCLLDREEQLSQTESALLQALMESPGVALSRAQLLAATHLGAGGLRACLEVVRRKLRRLDSSHGNQDLIVHVVGGGHRLAVERLDIDRLDWPLEFAGLRFRPGTRQLRCGRLVGTVEPKPALMLELLIRAAGEVVPDDTLIPAIWGETPGRKVVQSRQRALQRALDEVGAPVAVTRVRGIGYRLVANPTVREPNRAPAAGRGPA